MSHFILYTNGKGQYKKEFFETYSDCTIAFLKCIYTCYRGMKTGCNQDILIRKGFAFSTGVGELLTNKDIPKKDYSKYLNSNTYLKAI